MAGENTCLCLWVVSREHGHLGKGGVKGDILNVGGTFQWVGGMDGKGK